MCNLFAWLDTLEHNENEQLLKGLELTQIVCIINYLGQGQAESTIVDRELGEKAVGAISTLECSAALNFFHGKLKILDPLCHKRSG